MPQPRPAARRRALVVLLAVLALVVAGCARTVAGHGTAANPAPPTAGANPPSVPTSSASDSESASSSGSGSGGNEVSCPTIVDNQAGLSYPCIVNSMKQQQDQSGIWQTMVVQMVEANWAMNEGSRELFSTGAMPLTSIAATVMSAMKGAEFWGPDATAKVQASKNIKVDGVAAALLQTLMTVSPAYRKSQHLTVKTEMVWVVIVRSTAATAGAFFCSVPDDVKKYWPSIPGIIAKVKVAH